MKVFIAAILFLAAFVGFAMGDSKEGKSRLSIHVIGKRTIHFNADAEKELVNADMIVFTTWLIVLNNNTIIVSD